MGQLIDWHTHCWLPEHRASGDDELWRTRNVAMSWRAEPELHTAVMNEAEVAQFVVIAPPMGDVDYRFDKINEFVADYVAGHDGRAIGLASVHPADPGAPTEFERALVELGLKGLKISPTYQAIDPRSLACWRLYEIAEHYRVPVMFHCGGAYTGALEWADPCLLDKAAMAFPDLNFIVAHFGQPYMEQVAILMRKNPNVFADLSARFHRPWQLYNGIMHAIEYKVTDRLLFGSDFPVRTTRQAIDEFRGINDWGSGANIPSIPEEIITDILYERPLSLLGIEP